MLDAFSDIAMPDTESLIDNGRFSLKTQEGVAQDTYDFNMSINDPDAGFMGFEATDLRIVGSANIRDAHFGFEAPLNLLRVEVGIGDEDIEEILKINPKAKKPVISEFKLEIGEVTLGDEFPRDTQEEYDSLGTLLRAEIEKEIRNVY